MESKGPPGVFGGSNEPTIDFGSATETSRVKKTTMFQGEFMEFGMTPVKGHENECVSVDFCLHLLIRNPY